MPIRPENKARYPADWKRRSDFVRFIRARGQCEWLEWNEQAGDRERCPAQHGEPSPFTGSKVILTTAHWENKDPEASSLLNLRALCQYHHLAHDREDHRIARAQTRRRKLNQEAGQADAFDEEDSQL